MSILKHWFTERDNETFCPIRMLAIVGAVEFLVVAAVTAVMAKSFDMAAFGEGLAKVLGVVGGVVSVKAITEPKKGD